MPRFLTRRKHPAFWAWCLAQKRRARVAAAAGQADATTLKNGLSAWWDLEEASGTRSDAHTGAHHFTAVNAPAQVAAKVGYGLRAAKTGSKYLSQSTQTKFQLAADRTFALWVRLTDKAASHMLIGKTGGSLHEFGIYYYQPNDRFQFCYLYGGAWQTEAKALTFGSPSAATWYLLVVTFNSATRQCGIGVNAGPIDYVIPANPPNLSNGAFQLGNAAAMYGANADFDSVAVWDRILAADEIADLYNATLARNYASL